MDRKGLNNVWNAVSGAQEFENTFIYCPAGGKTETGIQPVSHVGEVLMGEQFQKQSGDSGGTAFTVGAVPGLAPCPLGVKAAADIVDHLGLDKVAEKAAVHP